MSHTRIIVILRHFILTDCRLQKASDRAKRPTISRKIKQGNSLFHRLTATTAIERLNKEFRRRTRPMEILAGEEAFYRILAFISLKMELHCRSNPVGKVRENLPFFKELACEYFTQKS